MDGIGTSLVIASNNLHKVSEIRKICPPGFALLTLNDINFTEELPETSGTIPGNALQKARTLWQKTHLACFSDDSGLLVEALDGAPGVNSATYAGEPRSDVTNVRKLLDDMEGVINRKAAFVTVIALILGGKEYLFEGRIDGVIAQGRRGTGGFGYDPVFIPEGSGRSFAEMTPEEKNSNSHRSRAVAQLIDFLKNHPS